MRLAKRSRGPAGSLHRTQTISHEAIDRSVAGLTLVARRDAVDAALSEFPAPFRGGKTGKPFPHPPVGVSSSLQGSQAGKTGKPSLRRKRGNPSYKNQNRIDINATQPRRCEGQSQVSMARRREWQRHAAQVGRARRVTEHEARDLLERAFVAKVRGPRLTHEAGAVLQLLYSHRVDCS